MKVGKKAIKATPLNWKKLVHVNISSIEVNFETRTPVVTQM